MSHLILQHVFPYSCAFIWHYSLQKCLHCTQCFLMLCCELLPGTLIGTGYFFPQVMVNTTANLGKSGKYKLVLVLKVLLLTYNPGCAFHQSTAVGLNMQSESGYVCLSTVSYACSFVLEEEIHPSNFHICKWHWTTLNRAVLGEMRIFFFFRVHLCAGLSVTPRTVGSFQRNSLLWLST